MGFMISYSMWVMSREEEGTTGYRAVVSATALEDRHFLQDGLVDDVMFAKGNFQRLTKIHYTDPRQTVPI